MNYYIIVFKNTLDAMKAEKKLESIEMEFKMMPTPTSITQSCGLCVRIDNEDKITEIIKNGLIEYKNIYSKNNNGYINID